MKRLYYSLFLSLSLLIVIATSGFSQTVNWERKYSSRGSGDAVQALSDGGYITISGYGVCTVMRTNSKGDSLWSDFVGSPSNPAYFSQVVAMPDGYLCVGSLGSHPYVIKFDQTGKKVWDKYIGSQAVYGSANSAVSVSDGLVFTGYVYSGAYHLFTSKLSFAGDSTWMATIAGHTTTNGRAMQSTQGNFIIQSGSGFVIGGQADSEAYLLKVDQFGVRVWDQSYTGIHSPSDQDQVNSVHATGDGGFILAGFKALSNTSGNTAADLIKTGSDGTITWRKSPANLRFAHQIVVESDGYVISCNATNGHLIKVGLDGNGIWDKELAAQYVTGLDKGADGNYVTIGAWPDNTLYLANISGASTPKDNHVYVYTSAGQPIFTFTTNATNGWQSAGPGKISSGSNAIVTVGGTEFHVSTLTIDTARTNPLDPVSFTGSGSFTITTSPLGATKSTFGSGAFMGNISVSGIAFDQPMTSEPSAAGLSIAISSISPNAAGASANGTLSGLGFWTCSTQTSKVPFTHMQFLPSEFRIGSIDDIAVAPGDCLRNISSKYDASTDLLTLSGIYESPVLFPSGVSAAVNIENGRMGVIVINNPARVPIGRGQFYLIDSLYSWLTYDYIPVFTALLPIGPKAAIKGTFHEQRSSEDLYQIDLAGGYFSMPANIHQENANFRLYKTSTGQYQFVGQGKVDITWGDGVASTTLNANMSGGLLPGGADYIFKGFGGISFSHLGSNVGSVLGQGAGKVTMPTLDLSQAAKLGPVAAVALAMYPPGSIFDAYFRVVGNIVHLHLYKNAQMLAQGDSTPIGITLDLTKDPSSPGYFSFDAVPPTNLFNDLFGTPSHLKHDVPSSTKSDTVTIQPRTAGLYVRIKGVSDLPSATLIDPKGTVIAQPLADSTAILVGINAHERWWVIDHPMAGRWIVNASGEKSDTIQAYAIVAPAPFTVTAQQTGKQISVRTNESDGTISLWIARDTLTTTPKQFVGSYSGVPSPFQFDMTDSLPECSYRLLATYESNGELQEVWSPLVLTNEKSILAAPTGLATTYSAKDATAVLTWNAPQSSSAIGYAIRLTGGGIDSVILDVHTFQTQTALHITDPNGKFVSILSYDSLGRQGCWSEPVALTTSGVPQHDDMSVAMQTFGLSPNPTRGVTTVSFTLDHATGVTLAVFNTAGEQMLFEPVAKLGAGSYAVSLNAASLPQGSYIVVLRTDRSVGTARLVVVR